MTLEKKAEKYAPLLRELRERIQEIEEHEKRVAIAREYSHIAEELGVGLIGLIHLSGYLV